jgi:hypothetical protein
VLAGYEEVMVGASSHAGAIGQALDISLRLVRRAMGAAA